MKINGVERWQLEQGKIIGTADERIRTTFMLGKGQSKPLPKRSNYGRKPCLCCDECTLLKR